MSQWIPADYVEVSLFNKNTGDHTVPVEIPVLVPGIVRYIELSSHFELRIDWPLEGHADDDTH